MAQQSARDRVLLGILDEQVNEKYRDCVTWETSKIGGTPDWLNSSIALPKCSLCGVTLVLVTQLYCPLQGSQYHRTLYIFACISRKCWNRSESWVVLRSQRRCEDESTGCCIDNNAVQDQWLEGQDDWGTCTDGNNLTSRTSNPFSVTDDNSRFRIDPNLNVQLMENLRLESGHLSPEGAVGMFEATADAEPADEGTVTIETVDVRVDRERWRAAVSPSSPVNRPVQLEEWFLSVIDEVTVSQTLQSSRSYDYEMSLLVDYQRREKINLNEVEKKCADTDSSEFYEQAAPRHGDKHFHKSLKQLQTCPNQLIRYLRGSMSTSSSPLFVGNGGDRRDPPTQCKYCRGKMVAELQLLPTLVNVLKGDGVEGPVIEFGTVVINTCQNSCWREGSDLAVQEAAVVYPDIYDSLIRQKLHRSNNS